MQSQKTATLGGLLLQAAESYGDAEAIVFPRERLTYSQLAERSLRHAARFEAMGLEPGDHIGILLFNQIEYVELMLGAALAGLVCVCFNARYKSAELRYVVANSDIRCLITTSKIDEHVDFCALLLEAFTDLEEQQDPLVLTLSEVPLLKEIFVLDLSAQHSFRDFHEFESLATSAQTSIHEASVNAPVIMMYTSGTTANPKGCLLSHRALVGNGYAMADRFEMSGKDRLWDVLPMFHMSSVLPFTACLTTGAAFICMEHFEPGAGLRQLAAEKASIAFTAFPTIMNALLEHPDFEQTDLSAIRLFNNVAPVDTLRYFQSKLPHAIQVSAYGMTEAGGVTSYGSPQDSMEDRMTTNGKPFDGIEVRIEDPVSGEELPPNEVGEILLRGYALFEGYYKDQQKTQETVDERGYLHTGDYGCVTTHGMISYRGRLKDMLKVGGENVAALEIESYLNTHPDVLFSQVLAVSDTRLNEVAAAFIERKPGATVSAMDLIAYCKGKISSFKIPRYIVFVEEWPMSATKVQKNKLKDLPLGERVFGK